MTVTRKKLIEVALPLDAINAESAREKSVRHGHPSTLHLWWARRPLAACRAVLFSSLVDDPAEPNAPARYLEALDQLPKPDPLPLEWETMDLAARRRERLFYFIGGKPGRDAKGNVSYSGGLVSWESSSNEHIIGTARELILRACEGNPPAVLDPFCGGGSIPLEAQRLGLETLASDLNPVAVLITKALIEVPPRFAHRSPVNPTDRAKLGGAGKWKGATGLAADVRNYGKWIRDQAKERIGHLYPQVKLPGGGEATVIAWLWARTVRCPNPGCSADMPLVKSFWLSTKSGREAWLEPRVDAAARQVLFDVGAGTYSGPHQRAKGGSKCKCPVCSGTKDSRGANFSCIVCGSATDDGHIKAEGRAGRMGVQLLAIVGEATRSRVYLPANAQHLAGC